VPAGSELPGRPAHHPASKPSPASRTSVGIAAGRIRSMGVSPPGSSAGFREDRKECQGLSRHAKRGLRYGSRLPRGDDPQGILPRDCNDLRAERRGLTGSHEPTTNLLGKNSTKWVMPSVCGRCACLVSHAACPRSLAHSRGGLAMSGRSAGWRCLVGGIDKERLCRSEYSHIQQNLRAPGEA